ARICRLSASNASRGSVNPKTTRPYCVKSWRVLSADSFLRQSSGNARSSRSISLRGWDAFSLTLLSPTLPTSTAKSVLLDGYLSRSKRRHSRCPGERARKDRRTRYESARQAELGTSSILSRPRQRAPGRGGTAAFGGHAGDDPQERLHPLRGRLHRNGRGR